MSLITEGEEKITKAKTKLVLKHPFFSIIALALVFKNASEDGLPQIDTMATDGKHVWWDELFVDSHTVAEIVGVVAHEVLHVVFMHMLRRGNRDPLIWNIACDYAINHIVLDAGLTLPANGLFDDKYRNWLVDAIYDDLIKNRPDLKVNFTMGRPDGDKSQPGQGQGESQGGQEDGDQDGQGGGKPDDKKGKGKGSTPLWGTIMEPRNDDGSAMSDAEKQELQEDIKIKVVQAAQAAKSVGKLPVALEGLIKAVGQPTINWKEYIQSWVSGKVPDDYTWKRMNRRMLGLYNILAPSMQLNGCGVGVISIDTSASVSDKELVRYVTEIVGVVEICNPDKLYIMQHDVAVNRVDVWEQGDDFKEIKITHRGGTKIKPSFKKIHEFDEEINWMICFTDMEILDYPSLKDAPDFPVLWAATGPDKAPFGTYLSLLDPIAAVS